MRDVLRRLLAGELTEGEAEMELRRVQLEELDGQARLDLCYEEDSAAQTDMNVVCTGDGDFVEIQGTAEQEPFSRELLNELLDLGIAGCAQLTRMQREALAADLPGRR